MVELTAEHPQASLNELWRHFHQIERPTRPTADDAVAVLAEAGLGVHQDRWTSPSFNVAHDRQATVSFAWQRTAGEGGDAMSDSLPERPDLDQLRRQAKELRDAVRRGDAAALERVARHHPCWDRHMVSLAASQLVVARELGFASWPSSPRPSTPPPLPAVRCRPSCRRRWRVYQVFIVDIGAYPDRRSALERVRTAPTLR